MGNQRAQEEISGCLAPIEEILKSHLVLKTGLSRAENVRAHVGPAHEAGALNLKLYLATDLPASSSSGLLAGIDTIH